MSTPQGIETPTPAPPYAPGDTIYDLVAGALSSEPARAQRSGAALGLDPARSYGSYQDMAAAEAKRPDGIEAVAIVTPNHMHAPVAKAFLQAGIHVICDKPLTATLEEAKALAELARKSGRVFAVTYNYTGYPMVRQARAMGAVPSGRSVRERSPRSRNVYISFCTTSEPLPEVRWKSSVSSKTGVAIGR